MGQVAVDAQSNEITALPALLRLLDLKGGIVTIAAMGCQKALAEQIVEQEADDVLTLKAHHGRRYEEGQRFFGEAQQRQVAEVPPQYYSTLDGKHGRIEDRRSW